MQERNYLYKIDEDDGLQVQAHAAPEIVFRETEGLQTRFRTEEKEIYRTNVTEDPVLPPRTVSKRKRWVLYTALIASALTVLAIILASYFGVKAATRPSPSPSPSPSPLPTGTIVAPMQKSTSGAWNGTGIAAFNSGVPAFWGSVVYQDFTGTLKEARWTFANTSLSILSTRSVGVSAVNATALWGSTYSLDSKTFYYHLIYVDRSGVLTDLWRNSSAIDAPWNPGNLSALNFHCPTDGRPAIGGEIDGNVHPESVGQNATRLWVGGADGAMHQLTMNWTSWAWSSDDYVLPQSYAYGAAAGAYGYGADGTPNTTVYSTLPGGEVQLHFSIDGSPHDARDQWPHGSWLDPVNSSLSISPNSSVFASWNTSCAITRCDSYLLYPDVEGKLSRSLLDSSTDDAQQIGSLQTSFSSYQIMPGSDLKGAQGARNAQGVKNHVLFHQVNGSDIAWFIMSDDAAEFEHGVLEIT